MNATLSKVNRSNSVLDNFTAELADAAFPIALRHGIGDNWLELKLELWKALDGAIKSWTPILCQECTAT